MTSAPELQQKLFKRMGLDVPEPKPQRNGTRRAGQQLSRKEQRKAQRVQKRTHVYARATPQRPQHINHAQRRPNTTQRKEQVNKSQSRSPKQVSDDEDDLEDEDEDGAGDVSLDEDDGLDDLMDDEEDDNDDDEEEEEKKNTKAKSGKKGVSKAAQERLAQDDAEIEAFERKLGIKKGRKSLPQSFREDGLGDLLGNLSGEEDVSDNDNDNKKRKSEYDDWLASKRRKTVEPAGRQKVRDVPENEERDDDTGLDDESGDDDEDMDLTDEDDEDGGDFDNDDEEDDVTDTTPAQPRQRENPYVAPTTGVTVAKYVPPSLRRAANSEEERKSRLRKQVQGLINRLTDANILSIVKSVEELYQNNARGDVTDVITDAIMAQISKPESLPDQFFVLTGGFAAAIYRLIGSSFGSVSIRRIVEDFGGHYEQASKGQNAESAIQKEASNILTLLSQLYVFEVVTCKIIFDYMERLLSDLNEINVELLLRICRMAGRMLKQDDQQSLKHVSGVLNQSVSKVGYTNISARTKFMVETITDLTKGKKKARGLDFTVVSEHVQRMKKRLGELKSQSRRLDGLAPMGVGLVDIEGAETRGKWWLVGASVPTTLLDKSKKGHVSDAEMSDHEDMDIVLPDYPKKARAQGLSGTAQIAIFTALMTASNFEHAYRQFVNLRLKKDDQLALATVLVQCVGSEMQYNPYYALVGGKACLSNSRIRFAIQDRLWKIFRSLGESMFGEAPEEDESADAERMKDERRIANVAKFYAALVADGTLNIAILKPLELPEANHWTSMFVQLFILALLKECRSKKKGTEEDTKLKKIFGVARDLPGLAAGIHWMIRKKVRRTKLVSAKESKKLEGVCEKAQIIVRPAAIEV
ncbi:related to SGD1-involved in HOG pathway [Fusarium fujikuroi IMI 58289]|uniref:Related to SGD1-involved in HOG pathway n=1 Tax=Gibberella fujikuroi (strain CBS 195.34 / IMI 58289 / NRRL A-6831) TaxID=1279085 RepID=S0E165_GIBF5|nr:related to SGD1-involved in HOG pathway [Fusarium fujikuroi IMI 58289]KLP22262.1 SGD1-involved in HOG pathway [Fusarium fujikuroi]CCT67427.1 related to SGD1-involved in HOG pathway [Fusarium fujikuroi IMI 58289]SCN97326.1 related to SGD1-involved in HOG pathway [Fusarium fujikuroi]SCO41484.1 related to SGD1-involved in HOG pathway [Fusarium fujikuroi]